MTKWTSNDTSNATITRALSRRPKRNELESSWARAMNGYIAPWGDAGQLLDFCLLDDFGAIFLAAGGAMTHTPFTSYVSNIFDALLSGGG